LIAFVNLSFGQTEKVSNKNLSFIKRKELSVNARTALFNNSITADASFFVNSMEGLIIIPSTIYPSYFSSGYPSASFIPYTNINNNKRTGFDFNVNYNKKMGEVDLNVGVSATYYTTEATKRDENYQYAYQNRTGKQIDGVWGLKTVGFFNDQQDVDNSPKQKFGGTIKPGDLKYVDQNNDNIIDEKDEVYLGRGGWYGTPLTVGVNLTLKYKNFSFFALGTGGFGGVAMKNSSYHWVYGNGKYSEIVRERWTEQTKETATFPRLTTQTGANNFRNSDFWLYKTDRFNIAKLQLTYDYGVDKLWVLNVGDLKPMEYPITLFLDMAWNPKRYAVDNLLDHPRQFCAQQFGEEQADEAMRILNLYSKYAGRVTAEMLDRKTYNLETGEWKQVSDEFIKLEAEALRQYMTLQQEYKDAYKQLILFPVQAMANLYEMYYAQAMNHKLYKENNPQANYWADKVEQSFKRDKDLCDDYNNVMSGGKWKNMMIQKHIGYTSWNDNFPADKQPEVYRIEEPENAVGGYVFKSSDGVVAMEAEHYFEKKDVVGAQWTVIPYMGRTLSGMALMPYTKDVAGASLSYKMEIPKGVTEVTVHIVVKSTLAFHDIKGHKYEVGFNGGNVETINFNANLNEEPENVYTTLYPTVARRVVESQVKLELPISQDGLQTLTLKPLDPGIVFEKIVVDFGGYRKTFLFMNELLKISATDIAAKVAKK
jgi:hypothetical protein